jgi:hypothetical protein
MTDILAAQRAPVGGAFSIGGCLKRALSTFFANFISFNLLGLIVILPGILLVVALFGTVFASFFLTGSADATPPDFSALHFGLFGVVWVLMVSLQYFLTAVIVYGALRHLRGNKAGFFDCLMHGLRRILPIIAIAIVTTVLVTIGMMLLVVPGIIIALMICLAIPVLMVENPGALKSLSRSRELTKGYRWHILGVLLLAFVITTIINVVVPIPFDLVLPQELSMVVTGVLQLFTTVFLAVVLAVMYHDLRVAKEGVSTAQLAAVFD